MADEGPTTVATIVGKLRMEMDLWKAAVAQVKADAREIGNLDPRIDVHVNVAQALAQLETLEAATKRLGTGATITTTTTNRTVNTTTSSSSAAGADAAAAAADRLAEAQTAAASAAARATLAEMRLEEVRSKGTSTARQLLAAEIAESEAKDKAAKAAAKAAAAEEALERAHKDAAKAALGHAAAEEVVAAATQRAGNSAGGALSRFQMMAAAIGLLLPLAAPLTAFAVGWGSALVGMGAAGLLAIRGIKQEMEAGTAVGRAYSAGLAEMKTDLDGLSRTSAIAMLSSFQRAQALIRDNFPALNSQMAVFSGLLGRSGTNLLEGVLNSLVVLNPLMERAGVSIERMSAGFASWTSNGGLQKFADYAVAVLPKVEETIGALFLAIMHILEALAPLGSVGLSVIKGVADTVNAIPVEVLTTAGAAATGVFLAFRAWSILGPIITTVATSLGAVGVATSVAAGPVGVIVTAVGLLAGAFILAATNADNAAAAQANYTAAVEADSGAIAENVKAAAAKALLDEGAYDAAKKLGISTELVTKATLGDAAAKRELNQEMLLAQVGTDGFNERMKQTGLSQFDLVNQTNLLRGAIEGQSGGIQGAVADYQTLEEALRNTAGETDNSAQSAAEAGEAYMAQAEAADALLDSLTAMLNKLMEGNNLNADAVSANINYQDALAKTQEQIDKVTAGTEGYSRGLDVNTATGRDNMGMLLDQASASQEAANKQFELDQKTQGTTAATDALKGRLDEGRQKLIEQAMALGASATEAQDLANKIYGIPTQAQFDMIANTDVANSRIQALRAEIDAIPRYVGITISTDNIVTYSDARNSAGQRDGGTIGLAGGGTPGFTVRGPGSPHSDTAGTYRLADGEEVISNRMGQAAAWRPLLKQINAGTLRPDMIAGRVQAPAAQPALDVRPFLDALRAQKPGVTVEKLEVNNPVPLTEKASTVAGLRRMADELGM